MYAKTSFGCDEPFVIGAVLSRVKIFETLFMLFFASILVSSTKCERSWIHLSQAKDHKIDLVAAPLSTQYTTHE